jgi:DNA-directed RNA polymerase specialized sigma24 family protein
VVAARISDMGDALTALDPESRALLDLSLRRGMDDSEIAAILRVEPGEVARRRGKLLDRLADELGLETREQRDELFASLPDLPDRYWRGQAARA